MAIFYTILVGIFIHKELTLKSFMASLKTTSWLTGRVLVLVFTATAFGYLLTSYRIPVEIANWILSFTNNVNLVWFFVVILLLFLGMFMETLAIIMLVTPVLLPIMTAYGVDPIHFGIILICCCGIGFSTPPLGENMFIASGIANISLEEISLKALPLVAINIAVIAILVMFPDIVLFLPNLMGTGCNNCRAAGATRRLRFTQANQKEENAMSCKTIVSLLMAGFFLCAASASAAPAAAPHTTLTIAMGDPESSEMGVVGNAFKKYVEDKTNGAIQVVCIYGGSPGDDEGERFRKVQKGTLDMALGGIANIVPLEKKLGLLTLPYLFANLNEVVAGTNGAPAELLNKYATEAGFRILTWTYTGFRFISNDKHPITKLSDMKGLKFRVPQSAVMIATYKAFGAIPSLIPWSMTFNALQSGDVDGQCYGYIGFRAMKFNEANQRYLTEVHYTYHLQPLVISERVFEKLTPEVRQILIDAGKYAQEKSLLFQVEQAEASKRELVAGGLKVSQLEDEDQWKKVAIEKVWPEMADFVGGKDAINEYLKACGKQPWN